jgi:hypothetical protein
MLTGERESRKGPRNSPRWGALEVVKELKESERPPGAGGGMAAMVAVAALQWGSRTRKNCGGSGVAG